MKLRSRPAAHGASAACTSSRRCTTACFISGFAAIPTANSAYGASIAASAPCSGSGRPAAPPRWRTSIESSGESVPGPAASTKASIASAEKSPSSIPSPAPGTGSGGSMCSAASPGGAIIANVSISGPELAQRRQLLGAAGLVPEPGRLDHNERAPAQRLGDLLQRRHVQQASQRAHLLRHAGGPPVPGLEHLGRSLLRPEQHARVELANREQLQLERGDDAEATAAAAQRPEQVGLAVGVGAELAAVRGNHLGGPDAVGGQPVAADHPARAATERVAGHAHVGRRARQPRQPMLGGRAR